MKSGSFFLTMFVAGAAAFSLAAAEVPPKIISSVAPVYPASGTGTAKEGWVYLKFKVTKDGAVENVAIAESYPAGFFDDAAITAIKNYKFSPKMVDGKPVDEPEHKHGFTFATGGDRVVSRQSLSDFRGAQKHLVEKDAARAETYMKNLRARIAEQKFNLTEVARYYQLEGLLAIQTKDYGLALRHIDNALRLAAFLDSKDVVDNLHVQNIIAMIGVGRFGDAVDYYDSWRKIEAPRLSETTVAAIENLRKQGYGRGREFEIQSLRQS